MKKVLFIASITGHIRAFHLPYLEYFKNCGYTVEVASNGDAEVPFCDTRHQIEFQRSPFKKDNINAYKKLKNLIEKGEYEIIHCHTPVAAIMTRLAARKVRKKGTRVMYTAHGFHFFKGSSLKNWLIYFTTEWLCSFLTDTLITMNEEDFEFAKNRLHAKNTYYIHGIGVSFDKFGDIVNDRDKKREELGIPKDGIVLLSVGELSERKNHRVVIEALSKMKNDKIYYLIAGRGGKKEELEELATKLQVRDKVSLLGFRSDIPELCKAADMFCFPSFQEGLPVSVMEAMCIGVPIVCSKIRGNVDLIEENKGGFLFNPSCAESVQSAIEKMLACDDRQKMVEYNKNKVKPFMLENVKKEMTKIYEEALG